MNHTEYTIAKVTNRLAMAMPTTRGVKVILGLHITWGVIAAIIFFCASIGGFGDYSNDNRGSAISGSLFLTFFNGLWVWACLVAYLSIEKVRDHCRMLAAEAATSSLLQARELATK
jgi:hypothetical protein